MNLVSRNKISSARGNVTF